MAHDGTKMYRKRTMMPCRKITYRSAHNMNNGTFVWGSCPTAALISHNESSMSVSWPYCFPHHGPSRKKASNWQNKQHVDARWFDLAKNSWIETGGNPVRSTSPATSCWELLPSRCSREWIWHDMTIYNVWPVFPHLRVDDLLFTLWAQGPETKGQLTLTDWTCRYL